MPVRAHKDRPRARARAQGSGRGGGSAGPQRADVGEGGVDQMQQVAAFSQAGDDGADLTEPGFEIVEGDGANGEEPILQPGEPAFEVGQHARGRRGKRIPGLIEGTGEGDQRPFHLAPGAAAHIPRGATPPHGINGTVEIEFCGEPVMTLSE